MSDAENDPPTGRKRSSALELGPRKKACVFFTRLKIVLNTLLAAIRIP
jgi:hypothetical protein